MGISKRSQLIAAAVFFMLPAAVNASTITYSSNLVAGQIVNEAEVILPNQEVEFKYFVQEDLNIQSFSLSGTGTSSGGDVADIRFGFTSPGTNPFSTIVTVLDTSFGGGFLPGLKLMAGDVFSIFFNDGIVNPVGITLAFTTEAPAPVPVPASGMFLGAVVFAFGAFAARKRKMPTNNFAV